MVGVFCSKWNPSDTRIANSRSACSRRITREFLHFANTLLEENRTGEPGAEKMPDVTRVELVKQRIEFGMENLEIYLEFAESHLQKEQERQGNEVKNLDQALIDTFGDSLETDADVEILQQRWGCDDPDAPNTPYSPLNSVFPRCLRYSFVAFVGLLFESELRIFCNSVAIERSLQSSTTKGKESALEQAKEFLIKQADVKTVSDNLWRELHDMVKIRNCIVHFGGRIDASKHKNRLEHLSKTKKGLWIDSLERPGDRLLIVERAYCESIVKTVRTFFDSVFAAV